ncbi:MAG: hypothetical protein HOY44_03410 [Maritimibacter sp.]|uniref:hypothetical protein n=1 Tax=Maritimibacter sp. TaxID=2003363 RepID=UPI001D58C65A|nr:hypothetical protein [Maritimibacter sp.]MBL6426560.1 hypothetical protein [Maritimibacter sp.]
MTTQTKISSAGSIGYVLVSHGAINGRFIGKLPGARMQIANIATWWELSSPEKLPCAYEYRRKPRSLDDLPILRVLLERAERIGNGLVLMDDLSRLFRNCPLPYREPFFREISAYRRHIFGIRQRKRLGELSEDHAKILVAVAGRSEFNIAGVKRRVFDAEGRDDSVRIAAQASLIARKKNAARKAIMLAEIRDEIESRDGKATLASIAMTANEKGLRTTRHKLWSASSVKRALDTFDQTEVATASFEEDGLDPET